MVTNSLHLMGVTQCRDVANSKRYYYYSMGSFSRGRCVFPWLLVGRHNHTRPVRFLQIFILIVLLISGCASDEINENEISSTVGISQTLKFREVLKLLRVNPETNQKPYDADLFKYGDTDEDGDCLRARDEVLMRDSLVQPVLQRNSNGCVIKVVGGEWLSWYDNVRTKDPQDLQIDHLVSKKQAWVSGASEWNKEKLERFGNDLGYPGSLIAVTTKMNGTGEKGSKDPSEWLPPENKCKFSQNYVAVKYRWGLAIDNAELQVLTDQLAGHCGDQLIEVELVPN